jgi:hypothetical protein
MPVEDFRRTLERLNGNHRLEYPQIGIQRTEVEASPSGQRIRKYVGSPGPIIERLSDRDGPVVHGAAATDAVLDASQLKLVCCARGGPVNTDVEAATERRIPFVTTSARPRGLRAGGPALRADRMRPAEWSSCS